MFIGAINDILHRANSDEILTYDGVNKMFMEWEKFRSRSDFRDHMRAWFMGDDLDSLPPPPEPKEEEPSVETPGEDAESPAEFGGNYAEDSNLGDETVGQSESESTEDSSPDPLPEGQDADGPARETSALP